jgi:hypothetical protein
MATKRFKLNQSVKVIGNAKGSHNFPIGVEVKIVKVYPNYFTCNEPQYGNYTVYDCDLSALIQTKADVEAELADAKATVALAESKLAYMQEIGTEEFVENEFKVWTTLTAVDNTKLSKLEKTKLIASLLN